MRWHLRNRGFTLLELLAVITIIGIISALVISRVSYQAFDAKKKCCWQYCADINSAIEVYRFEKGSPPTSLSDLQGTYYPDVLPKCPITNADYTMDGTLHRVIGHGH